MYEVEHLKVESPFTHKGGIVGPAIDNSTIVRQRFLCSIAYRRFSQAAYAN